MHYGSRMNASVFEVKVQGQGPDGQRQYLACLLEDSKSLDRVGVILKADASFTVPQRVEG